MRITLPFMVLGCVVFSAVSSSSAPLHVRPDRDKGGVVRVALVKNVPRIEMMVRGFYQIADPQTGQVLFEARRMRLTPIEASAEGIRIGGVNYPRKNLSILARKDMTVFQGRDQKSYRGRIDIIRDPSGTLTLVNHVDIEDYVRGILYHEMSHRWAMEALKAQAVVARTYACYQIENNRGRVFDVTSGIYSQVYGGKNAERYRTNIAVSRTRGQILTYRDQILPAYYHSTCGGHTEDVTRLWKHVPMAPLMGVRCRFCSGSPHFRWKKSFKLQDIQDKLHSKGHALEKITDIRIASRDPSGRIDQLVVTDSQKRKVTLAGKDFREIIGPNDLKSNNYEITMKGSYCDFNGKGWGHGVGLCQWGAHEMSQQRYDYKRILNYYYPGAKLEDKLF